MLATGSKTPTQLALKVIDRKAFAMAVGIAVSNCSHWARKGYCPEEYMYELAGRAREAGLDVTVADLQRDRYLAMTRGL